MRRNTCLDIAELIRSAATSLIAGQEFFAVEFENVDGVIIYKIDLHKDDRSTFMGELGQNMRALRTLCDSIAQKSNIKIGIIIND